MWILEVKEYSEVLKDDFACLIVLNSTAEAEATKEAEEIIKEDAKEGLVYKLYNAVLVKEMSHSSSG